MSPALAHTRSTLLWGAIVTIAILWVLRDLAVLVGYSVLLAYALLPVVRATLMPSSRAVATSCSRWSPRWAG